MIDVDALGVAAREIGFEVLGVAPLQDAGNGWLAPHAERLRAWLDAGMAADMGWIGERLEDRVLPSRLLPEAQAAIALFISHRCAPPPRPPGQVGRVAAYAWGRDYHNVVRKMGRKLRRWLSEAAPDARTYLSIDAGPVLERAVAERGAVGWIGKSTMLIHPQLGTYGTLAALFVDQPVSSMAPQPHPFRCGTCTDCIDKCPTGAISELGVDARLCISYWTIEHRGLIPAEIRPLLGDWAFGCDVCQDVCPWNRKAPPADASLWRPQPERVFPDLVQWLQTDNQTLDTSLNGSPMRRARPEGLRRNALIVLANTQTLSALPAIEAVLREEPDPVLRATAAWAARVLGSPTAAATARADKHPLVQAEATSLLPPPRP